MKYLFYILFALPLLFSCGNSSSLPEDIEYSIVEEDRDDALGNSKIRVRLNKKTTKSVLQDIASEIKSERKGLDRIWIFYYLQGESIDGMAWATSHFNPTMEVNILGTTEDEDKKAIEEAKFSIAFLSSSSDKKAIEEAKFSGEIIGTWKSESLMGAIVTLFLNEQGQKIMKIMFKSETPMEKVITESNVNGEVRLLDGNEHGEYYIIEANGNLGLYSEDGKFEEAKKI